MWNVRQNNAGFFDIEGAREMSRSELQRILDYHEQVTNTLEGWVKYAEMTTNTDDALGMGPILDARKLLAKARGQSNE